MSKIPGLNSNVFFDPVGLPFSQVSSGVTFPSGAVAYYKLDEVSGAVIDSVSANNGTNFGAVPNVAGKINTAYSFVANDYITMGDNFDFNFNEAFSFSYWVKLNSLTDGAFFSKLETAPNYTGYNMIHSSSGIVTFTLINILPTNRLNVRTDTAILSTGVWFHLAVTKPVSNSASDVKIYLNGVSQSIVIVNDTLTATTLNAIDFELGARTQLGDLYLDGTLDEFAIFNKELSATEVSNLYKGGAGLPFST